MGKTVWLTVIIASVIFAVAVLVLIFEIRKRIQGKPTCSCGGSCSSCPVGGCQYATAVKKESENENKPDING